MHKGGIMRTTLDLPESLLAEAMDITHTKTKTEIIIVALENLLRKSKLVGLKNYKGKVNIDIDIKTLRKRK